MTVINKIKSNNILPFFEEQAGYGSYSFFPSLFLNHTIFFLTPERTDTQTKRKKGY